VDTRADKNGWAQDYDAVHKIQAGYKITPLSQNYSPPIVTIDPSVDMKTPPKVQVDTMPADKYFAYAAELRKVIPPHITDQPMIALLKKIGFERGKSFELDKANPVIHRALESAPEDAQQLMTWAVPKIGRVANGWSMQTDTIGVYGNYYLKRAIVAQLGLGANLPRMPSTPTIWAMRAASRWMAQISIRFTSRRARRHPQTPSGRSHFTTPKAFRSRTPLIGLTSPVGCH
jgi:hypothetical protein